MKKYLADDYRLIQKTWWIFEIFKDFSKRSKDSNYKTYFKNNWIEFHPFKWGVHTTLQEAGYFDERPQLQFYLSQLIGLVLIPVLVLNFSWWLLILTFVTLFVGIGAVFLCFPFKTGIDNCGESKQWGFYIYYHEFLSETNLVICNGKKRKYIHFPWNLEWYRTSHAIELVGGDPRWVHEFKGSRQDFWDKEKWQNLLWSETHPYTYVLNSGKVQNRMATITLEQREWRRKWLMWTTLFNQVRTTISIEFDDEVGERTGSWKGGTLGCGWDLKPNETPLECLRRMEKERKF